MQKKRGSWNSNFGFLMAAIGSAVGLGNIWGFPYKMGASGGFTFLMIYLVLAVFVGLVIMVSELAIGRRAQQGVVGAYASLAENHSTVARVLASLCSFFGLLTSALIMTFYAVLGGYCLFYVVQNCAELVGVGSDLESSALFTALLTDQFTSVVYLLLFMAICYLIVCGGIRDGIEKFSTRAIPALAVMLVLVIIRSLTLPGAIEGIKFMFLPGYALAAGYIEEAPSFITVLSTAGGQMFFSLTLAAGAMVTYGSYLKKEENLVKNSVIVVFADTAVALMAGLAVIPAAFALGGEGAAMQGPMLLYVTLQNVFRSMGTVGSLFGIIFYVLVFIAAIASAISLMEVLTGYVEERVISRGKTPNRPLILGLICLVTMSGSLIVALDGLGSNGLSSPMGFCWLDFFDLWAEGIAMPTGALLMSILLGWFCEPGIVKKEVTLCGNSFSLYPVYRFLIRFVVPLAMAFILLGQLDSFFGLGLF